MAEWSGWWVERQGFLPLEGPIRPKKMGKYSQASPDESEEHWFVYETTIWTDGHRSTQLDETPMEPFGPAMESLVPGLEALGGSDKLHLFTVRWPAFPCRALTCNNEAP